MRDQCKLKAINSLTIWDNLTQSVKLMSEKFDDFEKYCKDTEKIKNSLKQVNGLKERVKSLEKVSDDHEQYPRRTCLLFHRIEGGKDEFTDDVVVNMWQDKLELQILKKILIEVIGLESTVQERKGQ